MAYSRLAYIYDVLMEDAPYDDWQRVVEYFIKELSPGNKKLIDLGCGTGKMSNRFAKAGYEVTGVDVSEDMLSFAQSTTNNKGESVHYIHQDLRELEVMNKFDVAVSLCDVMNYITEEEELYMVFQRVAKVLNHHGLFIFDVHSLNYLQQTIENQVFTEIYDDISYIWLCSEGEKMGEVVHDLTFFLQTEQENLYERFDETHRQRSFSTEIYQRLLERAGFQVNRICADFQTEPLKNEEEADRIFFICSKK